MSTAERFQAISVADYLQGEIHSPQKHEYVAGMVYAMGGGTNAHNALASNVLIQLGSQLRGGPCQALNSDSKVRIRLADQTRFYYPDVSIVCEPNPPSDTFHDRPVMVVEVLSRATRRVDKGEKRDAYLAIPSLTVYLLVEQERIGATLYRRGENGFSVESYDEPDSIIHLPELTAELRLGDIYNGVEPTPEPN